MCSEAERAWEREREMERKGERKHKNSLKLQRSLLIFKYCAFIGKTVTKRKRERGREKIEEVREMKNFEAKPDG